MSMAYRDYLVEEAFPHMWCSGCSHGVTVGSLARAMAALKLDPTQTVVVSGIGCFGKADEYFKVHAFHGTHGRALAFATGITVAKPELKVIALMGDGDCINIGGNHFIHAARRNLNITAIINNNYNYGMTGGQYSASAPEGSISTTSSYGTAEPGIDICEIAKAAGATFVSRITPYHIMQMDRIITQALSHKGFSVVEVASACPTYYARYNNKGSAVGMMQDFKARALTREKYAALKDGEKENYYPIGILHQEEKADFHTKYTELQKRAKE